MHHLKILIFKNRIMNKLKIVNVDPKKQMPWDIELYSKEIGYAGIVDFVMVGFVSHKNKTVNPSHGYYSPNPVFKKLKKYAKEIGYTIN